jgi:acyl dehydratase
MFGGKAMIRIREKAFQLGETYTFHRTFTDNDVKQFASVSEDFNPIHIDEEAAKESIFKQRVVHGALVSSVFSMIFGTKFPGEGTIYAKEQVSYKSPVFLNKDVTFEVTLESVDFNRKSLVMQMKAFEGETVYAKGEALLYHFDVKEA